MSTAKIRLWLVRETPAARLYSKLPPERNPDPATDYVWIPKSVIEHVSKLVARKPDEHTVTLPDWIIQEKNL